MKLAIIEKKTYSLKPTGLGIPVIDRITEKGQQLLSSEFPADLI